jgi:aminopeptidase N
MNPTRLSLGTVCLAALLPAQSTADAIHYRLEIEPLFATSSINGHATETFASLVPGLSTLTLDLNSALAVSAVSMNSTACAFTRPTDQLVITLDQPYQTSQQFTVVIDYAGVPPASYFGGSLFHTHSGAQIAYTLSEPFYAPTWWPCRNVLDDKATFEMWITHPDTMTCASNGALQGVDVLTGQRLRSRWAIGYPVAPYLASFSVTNYQRRTDFYTGFGANMPVEFYVYPEHFASWTSGMNLVVPMLNVFSSVYGQYPFVNEKYGIAEFGFNGGMEHETITGQGTIDEGVTAHELAHQWWGDMITCATWHDIWLNEGFAAWSEAIWFERKPGGSLTSYFSRMNQNRPTTTSGPVYVSNIASASAIFSTNNVYDRGAWALHMLRGVLGDTVLFQCLANYRAAFAGGSATTDDFRTICEQTAGRDLRWFFDEWVMGAGSPAYSYAWRMRSAGGNTLLDLELDQTQTGRQVFQMPVPVRVTTTAGTATYSVWNDERNDQFVLPLGAGAAVTAVAIDPLGWILHGTPATRGFTLPFFAATPETVDVVLGASVAMHADQGPANAGRPYLVGLGLSGSVPGTVLFGLSVPLNFDALTSAALGAVNGPDLANFLGTLDGSGQMIATLRLLPGVALVVRGFTLTAAYVDFDVFNFASRPLSIQLQ